MHGCNTPHCACPLLKYTSVKVTVQIQFGTYPFICIVAITVKIWELPHLWQGIAVHWFITEGNGNIKPAFELVTGIRCYHLDKFHRLQASQRTLHLFEKWITFFFPTQKSGSKDKVKGNRGEAAALPVLNEISAASSFFKSLLLANRFGCFEFWNLWCFWPSLHHISWYWSQVKHSSLYKKYFFLSPFLELMFVSLPYHFHSMLHSTKDIFLCAENSL